MKTRLSLYLLCIFLLLATIFDAGTVYARTESKTVRVGYFQNEIFQEGAEEGEVRSGYAYEYYQKLSEYTGWDY